MREKGAIVIWYSDRDRYLLRRRASKGQDQWFVHGLSSRYGIISRFAVKEG